MSNKKVCVPRDLLARAVSNIGFAPLDGAGDQLVNRAKAQEEVRAILAKPAEQHHGEPVGRTQFDYDRGFTAGSAECDTLRAQLVERDALLREVLLGLWPSTPIAIKINATLSASAEPSAPKCKTCNGTCMVDDGEITCSEGGIPYENGPVKCVKDCPDCMPVERDKWVPVAERKPDYEKVVLVAFDTHVGKNYTTAHLTNQKRCADPRSTAHDEIWYVHVGGGHQLKTVTHWREIDRSNIERKPCK